MKHSFHYLTRAVIRARRQVLLAHLKGSGNTFLPGGHIESGEGARSALVRELNEELGCAVEVGRFIGAVEHTWRGGDSENCEINLVFEVDVPGLSSTSAPEAAAGAESDLEFLWLDVADLGRHNVQPSPLVEWFQRGDSREAFFWGGSTIDP